MISRGKYIVGISVFCSVLYCASAMKCYQCSSAEEPDGQDNCGAYSIFDKDKHTPIDCNSEESYTPGSFCMKVVQQGPIGYVWDGRWRQVIRRCASVAESAVSGVCNWGVYESGIYWEECYCAEDGCNKSHTIQPHVYTLIVLLCVCILCLFRR